MKVTLFCGNCSSLSYSTCVSEERTETERELIMSLYYYLEQKRTSFINLIIISYNIINYFSTGFFYFKLVLSLVLIIKNKKTNW